MTTWLSCVGFGLLLFACAVVAFCRQYRLRAQLQLRVRLLEQHLKAAGDDSAFLGSINQSFIQQAPTAMLLVDQNAELLFFNPAAERQFGLSVIHLKRPLIQVVWDHELAEMVRRILDGAAPSEEIEIRPPGQDLVLRASARRIGGVAMPRGVAIVVEDLTELHRLETVRREFVANVSHELRTPLSTVKAMVETLELGGLLDVPRAARYLANINDEIDHLTTLVRDLLDLSRLESGRVSLHPEPVALGQLLVACVQKLRQRCERAGLKLEVCPLAPDLAVLADPNWTEQIVLNLVDNAIKFTPVGGAISLSMDADGRHARVVVRDSGVGIPEEDQPRIFERFYKVDKGRARQDNAGTGLGLAIVKHLAGVMGGGVEVTSTLGQGSSFSFTLPLAGSHIQRQEQEEVTA